MDNINSHNPEKDKRINLIEELIVLLNNALKTLRLYSKEHPSFLDCVSKLKLKFNAFFETEAVLEISLQKDRLFFGTEVIGEDKEIIKFFGEILYHLGTQTIIFRKSLTEDDIINFVELIAQNPDEVISEGGIAELYKQRATPFIEVAGRDTLEIHKEEEFLEGERAAEYDKLSDEEVVNEYFNRPESVSKEVSRRVLYILTQTPEKFSKLLINLSENFKTDSFTQLDSISNLIETTITDINKKYPDDEIYHLRRLTDSINFLSEDIRFTLINEKLLPKAESSKTASDIIGSFSTNDLIGLFSFKINKENISLVRAKQIIDKISSLKSDRKAEIILGLKITNNIMEEEIDSTSSIPDKGVEEIESLSLSDLEDKVQELSIYTQDEIRKIEELISTCSKDDIMLATTNVLLDVLPLISEINIYLKFVDMLQDFLEVYLSKDIFEVAVRILETFKEEFTKKRQDSLEYFERLESAIKEAGNETKIYNMILFLSNIDETHRDYKIINSYLRLLGENGIDVLLMILGKEEKRIIRKLIVRILIDIGQEHIEIFARKLNDERWYLVRNVISIFGEIRDEKAIDYIKTVLHHPALRVRSEAIRSLGLIGTDKSVQLLVGLLKDKDINLKQKVIVWLGEIGSPIVIPHLARILRKKDFLGRLYPVKEEIIRCLEKIDSPEVIPTLKQMSPKKWYQFGLKSKALRRLSEEALERLQTIHKG